MTGIWNSAFAVGRGWSSKLERLAAFDWRGIGLMSGCVCLLFVCLFIYLFVWITDLFDEAKAKGKGDQGQSSTDKGRYCVGMVLPKATRENGWPLLRSIRKNTANEGPLQHQSAMNKS